MTTTPQYRVKAYNTAKASENKMHDDAVARQFGFSGGLVTGVDLLAYMIHQLVAKWGRAFLERGVIESRFLKPVYDGDMLTLEAEDAGGALALRMIARGEVCASGAASLADAIPEIDLADYPATKPVAARLPVDGSTFTPVGKALGTESWAWPKDVASAYCRDVRDTEALYADQGLVHPGVIQRLMNRLLVENAMLGPWIHVGSRMQLLSPVEVGDALTARAKVSNVYEKKGHRFVELDAVAVANDVRVVAHCHHVAIYQPRQSAAA